jgi:undecaprenyl-diphosphatase
LAVHAPFERHSHRTFPSGHSQTAFSVAVFIVMVFRKHAAPWLAWAAMVAVSRVYLGVHFPLDIVAGMAVGSAVSALTVVLADKWSPARVAADAINAGVKKEL